MAFGRYDVICPLVLHVHHLANEPGHSFHHPAKYNHLLSAGIERVIIGLLPPAAVWLAAGTQAADMVFPWLLATWDREDGYLFHATTEVIWHTYT